MRKLAAAKSIQHIYLAAQSATHCIPQLLQFTRLLILFTRCLHHHCQLTSFGTNQAYRGLIRTFNCLDPPSTSVTLEYIQILKRINVSCASSPVKIAQDGDGRGSPSGQADPRLPLQRLREVFRCWCTSCHLHPWSMEFVVPT